MEHDSFTVSLGTEKFIVPKQLADVCVYFHNILGLGIEDE